MNEVLQNVAEWTDNYGDNVKIEAKNNIGLKTKMTCEKFVNNRPDVKRTADTRNSLKAVLSDPIILLSYGLHSGGAKGGPAGARAPAVKPCAPAVPRQLSYSDVDYKRISWLRATDYFEDVNYDVVNHAE